MCSRIIFLLKYWLCWILIFQLGRILFLFFNYSQANAAGLKNVMGSLFYGLRMDASLASYFVLPGLLLFLLGIGIPVLNKKRIWIVYTAILLFFVLLLNYSDLYAFRAWGYKIDASVLKYLQSPKEAMASIGNLPVFWVILFFIISYIILFWVFRKIISRAWLPVQFDKQKAVQAIILFITAGLFIIPLRGGLQLAPINQSSVYFSLNHFANVAAVNTTWNFFHSVNNHVENKHNPYLFMEPAQAARIMDSLYAKKEKKWPPAATRPNVIVIVWESFTGKALSLNENGVVVVPGFNELKKEGIYFSNIYASGDRTDKGIVAVLSGYPSQPVTSIIKIPEKASTLPTLGNVFSQAGYHTAFYYGGETEFANMKAYLLGASFQNFITVNDFKKEDRNSKWGAHDGVVEQKLQQDLAQQKQPFFYTWLTLSSHEPYEIPEAASITGNKDVQLFMNSLHYTDKVVTQFIHFCKSQPWWDNTIIVIVADHGHRLPPTGKKIDDFKIPLLFTGGTIKTNTNNPVTGSQTDIASTLLNLLMLPDNSFAFSKNLLDSTILPGAYFSFNDGFGFVNQQGYFIFDNVGKTIMEQNGHVDPQMIQTGKAYEQYSIEDYLKR